MTRISSWSVFPLLILSLIVFGCSGGKSAVTPDTNNAGQDARSALSSFAQACERGDFAAMESLLADPETDMQFLRNNREALPDFGRALRDARPGMSRDNWIEYRYRLPATPDMPGNECYLIMVHVRGGWKVSFDPPRMDTRNRPDRQNQWQTPTHSEILTKFIVEYYRTHYPDDAEFIELLNDESFRNEIRWGSFTEDTDGLPAVQRNSPHEMAPKRQDVLPASPQDFMPITDKGIDPGFVLPGINTLQWGLGMAPQMTGNGPLYNDYSWPAAVADFNAAQELSGEEKKQALLSAFHKFGHVLHLLEDMTCPAHARNDMHTFLTSDNDPFEDWANLLAYFSSQDVYDGMIAGLPAVQRDSEEGFVTNELLQCFFRMAESAGGDQNALYRDHPGVSGLFWYSCYMTNQMAFSEDTIYRSTVAGSIDTTMAPLLIDYNTGGINFVGRPPNPCYQSLVSLGLKPAGSMQNTLMATATPRFGPWALSYFFKKWRWPSTQVVIDAQKAGQNLLTVSDIRDLAFYVSPDSTGVRTQEYRLCFPLCVLTGSELLHEFYLETR